MMLERQLSLSLEERAGRPAARPQKWRGSRARWWFAQMRQAVECATESAECKVQSAECHGFATNLVGKPLFSGQPLSSKD